MAERIDFSRKPRPRNRTSQERIERMSRLNPETSCIEWLGAKNENGYGMMRFEGRARLAHLVAWILKNGPVPKGLVLDHVCRVRDCVNTDHLRAVTQRENTLAGVGFPAVYAKQTHCPRGHPYDMVRPGGRRACRRCHNAASMRFYFAKKAAKKAKLLPRSQATNGASGIPPDAN